jgi:3-dehydroquinate synthase
VRAGRAEMLKHELLANDAPKDGSALIHDDDVARSLSLKLSVVRRDRCERGLRTALNLGHTLAHALESVTKIGHGEAVRFGLLAMLALSVEHAGLDANTAAVLAARVRAVGPMSAPDVELDLVMNALRFDKKGAGRFVLLDEPGLPVMATPPEDAVRAAVRSALSPASTSPRR